MPLPPLPGETADRISVRHRRLDKFPHRTGHLVTASLPSRRPPAGPVLAQVQARPARLGGDRDEELSQAARCDHSGSAVAAPAARVALRGLSLDSMCSRKASADAAGAGLFGEYAPFGTMIERHCRRPSTYVNALLRGGLGGPTWSPERTGLSFCRVAGPELSRTVTSRAATSAGDHGIAQTARVRVARQPDATAAVATASRTASRVSCSGQYWLAGW